MEKTIEFRGSKIRYTVTGKGKPVIFLHGFAEDRTIWAGLCPELQEKYQLIIPDLPGSGTSETLNKEEISLTDLAECIHAITTAENLQKFIMIGHSMGGYIMLAFAEKYPEMLVAAGLFHSSSYSDDPEKIETREKSIGFIQDNGAEAFLKTAIPNLFKDPKKSAAYITEQIMKGGVFTSKALIQYTRAMISRPDRTSILKQLDISFLFILGEHDKAVPFQHSLEQSQLPAHSYVYILRNSAHMGMLEEKEKCIRILAEFLHDTYY